MFNREEVIDKSADDIEESIRESLKNNEDGFILKQVGFDGVDREIHFNLKTEKTDILVSSPDPFIRKIWMDMLEEALKTALKRFSKKDFIRYRH